MTKRGKSGLIIPVQMQSLSPEFNDFKLATVNQWLNELPRNNLGIMNKALYEFLVDLNHTDLSPQARYEVLETVLPHVSFISQALTKTYLDEQESSSDKKRKITLLIEILNIELNYGYKIIADTLVTSLRKQKPVLLKALHRISILSLEILQRSYQMYTSPPQHIWKELHIVYACAERFKLLNKSVEHFDVRPIRHATIINAYKHALLLACSNPYRLRTREIFKLNFALETWGPLLTLSKFVEKTPDIFMVDLQEDKPPFYIQLNALHGSQCLSLNFEKIQSRLNQIVKHLADNKSLPPPKELMPCELQLPLTMLKFLKVSWSKFDDRISNRIDKSGTLRVTLGLKATYAAIVKHTKVMNNVLKKENDENEIIYMDAVPLPQQALNAENSEFEFKEATYINISPAGFCFEWQLPVPKDLLAGEIIGIEQNPELEGILCIGMIRWIKHVDQHTVQCGVKLLSPYAIPMLTIIPDQPHQIGVKTLLLPAESRYHPYISLITPALPFKEGTHVTIAHGTQTYGVHLKSVVDNSTIFNQFNIDFEKGDEVPLVHLCHPHQMDALWNKFKF